MQDPPNPNKHIVVSGKQRILGVDGVKDVKDFNKYYDMQLYTGLPDKMKELEEKATKLNILPYLRTDIDGKTVTS
jgi:hypothetical protein